MDGGGNARPGRASRIRAVAALAAVSALIAWAIYRAGFVIVFADTLSYLNYADGIAWGYLWLAG